MISTDDLLKKFMLARDVEADALVAWRNANKELRQPYVKAPVEEVIARDHALREKLKPFRRRLDYARKMTGTLQQDLLKRGVIPKTEGDRLHKVIWGG